MTEPTSTGDWVAIITAIGGVAGATFLGLGKAFAWLASWGDRRRATREEKLEKWQRELTDREHSFETKQNDHYHNIEVKLANLLKRDEQRAQQIAAVRLAFELVAGALRVKDPLDPALRQAEQLMTAAFPLDPRVPPDMLHSLGDIDRMDLKGQ